MSTMSDGEVTAKARQRQPLADGTPAAAMIEARHPRTSVGVRRDPLYLFACHLEWRDRRNIKAYQELVAALDDPDEEVRAVAESLLHRSSPRPHQGEAGSQSKGW